LNGDTVVKVDEVADKMYFIHSGYFDVISAYEKRPLAFFSKGAYFGEIGVLITGTRTVSVRA
jgi:CRP-like cAMP-binding protein